MSKEVTNNVLDINKTIGERVDIVMVEKGMKLAEVAAKMRCHESKISKIKSGAYNISARDLVLLARTLKVSVAYLIGETNCKSLNPDTYLKDIVKKIIVSLLEVLSKEDRLEVIQQLRFKK